MSEETKFFMYLMEHYAAYKHRMTGEILREWESRGILQTIYDGYWNYHTECLQNAFDDIDSLVATGKQAW